MFRHKHAMFLFLVTSLLATLFVVSSQVAFSSKPAPRHTEECLDCHENYDNTLFGTPHQINAEVEDDRVACGDCHVNMEAHLDEGEDPPLLTEAKALELSHICATCHVTSHNQNILERNVHGDNDVNCTACHGIHNNQDNLQIRLLHKEQKKLCLECHQGIAHDFVKPFRHPVVDDVMTCSECHKTLDLTHRQNTVRIGPVCFQCHQQFEGPFPYQHQATVYYSTEEGGCLNCHAAHGSYLPRMTTQPYEAPSYQLCSQCHIVPGHQFNRNHGSQWAGQPCWECHVDIHGSYTNRFFLTPELESQGCYAVGCHQPN